MPKITKQCANCGKDITRYPSQFWGEKPYCSPKCNNTHRSKSNSGKNHWNWKGGRTINTQGYVRIQAPNHPRAINGYVLEHIIVMEKKLGRPLKKGEVVHHINHNRSENRPENLKLYSSTTEHIAKEHPKKIRYCKCGKMAGRMGYCKRHYNQLHRTGKTWDFENKLLKPRKSNHLDS